MSETCWFPATIIVSLAPVSVVIPAERLGQGGNGHEAERRVGRVGRDQLAFEFLIEQVVQVFGMSAA